MDPLTRRLVIAAASAVLVVILLLVVGGVVGGIMYGPALNKALTAASKGKADAAVAGASADQAQAVEAATARTSQAEVRVILDSQESTRAILSAPGAEALVSPDVYDRVSSGLRRNRGEAAPGERPASGMPAAGTAEAGPGDGQTGVPVPASGPASDLY